MANDPQYALLDTQRQQAQLTVQNLHNTINTIQQAITTQGTQSSTLFQVVDTPQVPYQPVSRTKNYLIGGGAGLVVALLACVIYLVIVVRRDQGVYWAEDLQEVVAYPIIHAGSKPDIECHLATKRSKNAESGCTHREKKCRQWSFSKLREGRMSETSEQLTTANEMMKKSITDPALSLIEVQDSPITDETQRLQPWREKLASGEDQHISDAEAKDHPAINGTEKKHVDLEGELPTTVDQPVKKANPKKTHDKKAPPET